MTRLARIRDECLPDDEKAKKEKAEKVDPFTAAKNKINTELRDIRNMIKERDQQEAENPGSTYVVELAHNVRMAIAVVQEDVSKLTAEHTAKAKKYAAKAAKTKKTDPKIDEQMQLRGEVLEVMNKHVEECAMLEKKRYGGGVASTSKPIDPTVTSLPDIDDPRFQKLIKTDKEIDALLDVLGKNVAQLKEMAGEMHEEAKAQSRVLDQLDVEVTRADAKLESLNRRLKVIVEKARPGSKFMVDFILICVLLGIGGAIYFIVKARF